MLALIQLMNILVTLTTLGYSPRGGHSYGCGYGRGQIVVEAEKAEVS